jgi:N-glycosylase/DNA lyase
LGNAKEIKATPNSAPGGNVIMPSSPPHPEWSAYQRLALDSALSPEVLAEIVDGGQAFRWNREPDGGWFGVFGRFMVRLRQDDSGAVLWSAPRLIAEDAGPALVRYFDLERSPAKLVDSLPWRSDPHLERCLVAFPGLQLLRQPFGETLLGFLCSATKQIVQIKQMVALLAQRHGQPLIASGTGEPGATSSPATHRLPTWEELAAVSEADLRACLLGFRARYIHLTAQFIAAHPRWLEETELLPYPEAKARLCTLPGVGEKVADCVLLFGAGRLESFPVDVWIIKSMALRYGLESWKPAQIAHFGRTHFGPLAGLAQQYLFAYERKFGRR